MPVTVRFIGSEEEISLPMQPDEEERFEAMWRDYIVDRNKPRGAMFRGAVAHPKADSKSDHEYGISVNFDAVAMVTIDRPRREIRMEFW